MKGFPGLTNTIMKSLFGKPATEMYPQRKRTYPPAARGRVENEIERCIFCRMCERNCPTKAIVVSKEAKEWQIDGLKCCSCRRCVEVCPVKCLFMRSPYFPLIRERQEGLYLCHQPPKRQKAPAKVEPEKEESKKADKDKAA
jgi:formate hydrogenlyase subunit 6/NADH:ubiquinone oxidoreductase subunit I